MSIQIKKWDWETCRTTVGKYINNAGGICYVNRYTLANGKIEYETCYFQQPDFLGLMSGTSEEYRQLTQMGKGDVKAGKQAAEAAHFYRTIKFVETYDGVIHNPRFAKHGRKFKNINCITEV